MSKKTVRATVEKIIRDVRKDGDRALVREIARFEKTRLSPANFKVPASLISGAPKRIDANLKKALEACARRVHDFHYNERKHITQSWTMVKDGVRMGQIYSALSSVGIYIPGGRFSYPSTLLMTAIPARLAGVERIVVVTPAARLSDEILAAAHMAGVKEIYRVGGPSAVAALAIGTKTIPKVDLIVGPGNAYVTEAKRQLFGEVGIDLLAGPSELVVLADETAPASYIAADMLAQAEHDPDSKSFLVSTSAALIKDVQKKIPREHARQCEFTLERDLSRAISKANELAGEHVEIFVKKPQLCLDNLKNGGTFFIGAWSPTAMGDYWAGSSHVLPTGRSARFASGLSVMTFMKRSSLIEISSGAYAKGWKAAYRVAQAEGLRRHAESLKVRMSEGI
jgi:histidinol dehydrogenase